MDKSTLVGTIEAERAEWDHLLARVGPDQMEIPDVTGSWSVKDVIAHVMWGEREVTGVARTHALAGSPLWDLPQQDRNEAVFEEFRDVPLDQVLSSAVETYHALLAALAELDDADMMDASRYASMPVEWEPWQVFASNTWEHYRAHTPDIRAWLARHSDTSHP